MRFRPLLTVALSLALIAVGITGCGQKGPLVLPKSQVFAPTSAPTSVR